MLQVDVKFSSVTMQTRSDLITDSSLPLGWGFCSLSVSVVIGQEKPNKIMHYRGFFHSMVWLDVCRGGRGEEESQLTSLNSSAIGMSTDTTLFHRYRTDLLSFLNKRSARVRGWTLVLMRKWDPSKEKHDK